MEKNNIEREYFNPDKIPLLGSLGLLALGDLGFEAWRKVKIQNRKIELDEEK